jgi:hypothetical protein
MNRSLPGKGFFPCQYHRILQLSFRRNNKLKSCIHMQEKDWEWIFEPHEKILPQHLHSNLIDFDAVNILQFTE